MTAHVGKGFRKGSRAEPGHRRIGYAHLPSNHIFGRKKGAGSIPKLVLGPRLDFCHGFWGLGGFGALEDPAKIF